MDSIYRLLFKDLDLNLIKKEGFGILEDAVGLIGVTVPPSITTAPARTTPPSITTAPARTTTPSITTAPARTTTPAATTPAATTPAATTPAPARTTTPAATTPAPARTTTPAPARTTTPAATTAPAPTDPAINREYILIDNENIKLQKQLNSIIDSTQTNTRSNTYFIEDKALTLYMNRVLLLVYGVAYFIMLFSLFIHRKTAGIPFIIVMIVIFFLFPFVIDGVAKYMYDRFISAMHLIYKGNALYLYKPPEKTNTL